MCSTIDECIAVALQDVRFAQRFWSKVNKTDSCWNWTGYRLQMRGRIRLVKNRVAYAARVSWWMAHGPIPPNMNVLHNCPDGDNPACVNPDHLWLGTLVENNADAEAKGRTWHDGNCVGSQCYQARLTSAQVVDLRSRPWRKGRFTEWGREFGVRPTLIAHAYHRLTYRDVP